MADEVEKAVGCQTPLHILNNPIDVHQIRETAARIPSLWQGPGPHLLAIGRLAPEKGFDLLLDAFAALRTNMPAASLCILGEGRERRALEERCAALGLNGSVDVPGHVRDPALWFPGASLFVLSSRHEAMPNALLEAAAAGLPIVATPASRGVSELLCGHAGVWLASEVSARALANSLSAAVASLRDGERFPHLWIEAFEIGRAVEEYERVLLGNCAQ